MGSNRPGVIAIVGPTCTGKSALALWLASKIDGEIINADSMQVFRYFDIGSAKPSQEEQSRIPHHLIDVVLPHEEFNAALFQRMADRCIAEIWSRDRTPLTVGGTGLYLRVLFHGLFEVKTDHELRQALRDRFERDPEGMYEELKACDPEYAASINRKDRVRVVRALEIHHLSGSVMSEWQARHGFREERYRVLKIGLTGERHELYRRINARVESMLAQGWIDEARGILKAGYDRNLKPLNSIGYREIVQHLKGELNYAEMVEKIKISTRHYAKRQLTWFAKEKEISWNTFPEEKEAILKKVTKFLD